MQEETIAAVATAMGEGSIGIIRLSGSNAWQVGQSLFRKASGKKLEIAEPRKAIYGYIEEPASQDKIDEALLLFMPGPHSYTGEDVLEFQLHGSAQSLSKTLELALLESGVRLAEPGEFTRRAFLNGRLDLSQAEAVIDVIRARTDRSLKAAAGQLGGALSQKMAELIGELLPLIGRLEVVIEYPEDGLEETYLPQVAVETQVILEKVSALRESGREGRILREGLATAIIGRPNVGKSSLLNYLLGEERAIVTAIAGTTRDIIEEYLSLGGIPLKLIDTAGIRETLDPIEQIGVSRSKKALKEAQLVLAVLDGTADPSEEELHLIGEAGSERTIVLLNKSDLPESSEKTGQIQDQLRENGYEGPILSISAQTGLGFSELSKVVENWAMKEGALSEGSPLVTNARQIAALVGAETALKDALDALVKNMPPDCILVDLREALAKIGEISGQAVSEDIITHIFSQFCLGK